MTFGKKAIKIGYLLTDILSAVLAWLFFFWYRNRISGDLQPGKFFSLVNSSVAISLFWILIYSFWGFYKDYFRKSRIKELYYLISCVLFGVIIIFLFLILDDDGTKNYQRYYRTTGLYFLIHLINAAFFKVWYLTIVKKLIQKQIINFPTLIVGNGPAASDIYADIMNNSQHLGLNFRGFVQLGQDSDDMETKTLLPALGHYRQMEEVLEQHKIEQVILAIEATDHQHLEEILNITEGKSLIISILPDMYQILLGLVRVQHVFGTPLIEIRQDLMPVWQTVVKRGMDISFSLMVLVFGSPFLIAVGLITKFTSRGPMLFRQERIGKDGVPFKIIKYRSMFTDAEKLGPALSSTHDPRITNWGRFMRKTRIDEFPQFFNVLVGDMSLVGPRPERQFFIDQIMAVAPHYRHLNRVRPGITSLGQVKYGYAENVDQMVRRLKFDIIYIENMTLGMDFRILIYTVLTVLGAKGK
jgi:exopolysaccharide biosynthesis polyprenyl glycosylphosphotransferase